MKVTEGGETRQVHALREDEVEGGGGQEEAGGRGRGPQLSLLDTQLHMVGPGLVLFWSPLICTPGSIVGSSHKCGGLPRTGSSLLGEVMVVL